ncbi:glycohydrolase toxin TNT-related protein [Chryseobacterium camelliae]|uniref:Glycohydrolase toxin TNT-related protein n=1 Tax=Chryseobacterium camelliae TaxID=1265445 RepID=A0ABY7QPE5_9FLAO|nr:glycohydrolase toxin TNT-related protein [Chryseobacterium camelliae]WBV60906.1 glycohydrolase toxin TNT-related protein [Chryseobacterium camelliae]
MKHLFKYLFFFAITSFSMACSSDNESETDIPPVKTVFYKNANEFALTYDTGGTVDQASRDQIFELYRKGQWGSLEVIFKGSKLNGGWPPANGGYNIVDDVPLQAGQKFDRYSGAIGNYNGTGVPTLGGSFTSPIINGYTYTFSQRALNQPENTYDFYYEIDVLNNVLPFKSQTADVIPWFGQVGGGKQTMWKIPIDITTGYQKTWNKLAQEGYVKIIIKKSPSGKYNNLVGTVIQ